MRFFENYKWQKFTLIAISLLLYANTFTHQYALDDAIVVTQNQYVKKGIEGIVEILRTDTFQGFFGEQKDLVAGGRYRPLSLITFAVEYHFGGLNPAVSHIINVLLYTFVVLLLWHLLRQISPPNVEQWEIIAWFSALFFAIHPVHTEVVANIKGRDEILAFLFSLLAWNSAISWTSGKQIKYLFLSTIYLFLGCLSKENVLPFVFIIPFSLWFFKKATLKKTIISALPLFVAALGFVIIRHLVLGHTSLAEGTELMNNPFLNATTWQRYGTIIFSFLWYIKLLIFPHPLTFDYYPYHVPLVNIDNPIVIAAMIVIAGLLILSITGLKKRQIASFWILFFFASYLLVSNLLFTVGTFMNERFMFIPSVSICFGLAWIIAHFMKGKQLKMSLFFTAAIIVTASLKTVTRNKVWYNDNILFTTDVHTSKNSAKSNMVVGGQLFEQAQKTKDTTRQLRLLADADRYLTLSLKVHPTYNDARLLKGNVLSRLQSPQAAIPWYVDILKQSPQHANAWTNAIVVATSINEPDEKISAFKQLLSIDSMRFEPNYQIGVTYARNLNNLDFGIKFMEKAYKINPLSNELIRDLGVAYGMAEQYSESEKLLTEALKRFPNDAQLYYNLGITLLNLNKKEEAQQCFNKAVELNPQLYVR